MRFLFAAVLALVSLVPLAGMARMRGSGNPKQETRKLSSFTEIAVRDALRVEISVGAARDVEVSGDDNLVPLVSTVVEGQRLLLELTDHSSSEPRRSLLIRVKLPVLTALVALEAAQVEARGLAANTLRIEARGSAQLNLSGMGGSALDIIVDGASRVTVKGKCRSIHATVSRGSGLLAREAEAEVARVSGQAASQIEICASKIEVSLSGASRADCFCNPAEVRQQVADASSIRIR